MRVGGRSAGPVQGRPLTCSTEVIDPEDFLELLRGEGVTFFAGVPDSLLKAPLACIAARVPPERHRVTVNEGSAVALVTGHHLGTGELGLVYLQNSGLGNALNPLASLAHRDVYGIPMLLLVGWRGEPGRKDEPQHLPQGRATAELLSALDIPCRVLPDEIEGARACVRAAAADARTGGPAALLVRAGSFAPFAPPAPAPERAPGEAAPPPPLRRADVVAAVASLERQGLVVLATTGETSRELYAERERRGDPPARDFLTVGSMGHASQIALGLAAARPELRVVCVDGDGALLMHMGGMAAIGAAQPANLIHVGVSNRVHESVGGQPTAAPDLDLGAIASACGYRAVLRATSPSELDEALHAALARPGPIFIDVRAGVGAAAKDLPRPSDTPRARKDALMDRLGR